MSALLISLFVLLIRLVALFFTLFLIQKEELELLGEVPTAHKAPAPLKSSATKDPDDFVNVMKEDSFSESDQVACRFYVHCVVGEQFGVFPVNFGYCCINIFELFMVINNR